LRDLTKRFCQVKEAMGKLENYEMGETKKVVEETWILD
jgi:hypothetical protein